MLLGRFLDNYAYVNQFLLLILCAVKCAETVMIREVRKSQHPMTSVPIHNCEY